MTEASYTAWNLIGFDGTMEVIDRLHHPETSGYAEPGYQAAPAMVRVKGGQTLYEAVGNEGGTKVRLSRLDTHDMRAVVRYVDPTAILEVVPDAS